MDNPVIFYAASRAEWERWLEQHHLNRPSVWLVFHTKASGIRSLSWSEAVDVALCFGWIDSKKIKVDKETSHQLYCPRKPQSTWSRINKQKVDMLIRTGRMRPAGLQAIKTAKANGSWTILDEVEDLVIPDDLAAAFSSKTGSQAFFSGLSRSDKKMILQWIVLAKRPETRQKRLLEVAEQCGKSIRPIQLFPAKRSD